MCVRNSLLINNLGISEIKGYCSQNLRLKIIIARRIWAFFVSVEWPDEETWFCN